MLRGNMTSWVGHTFHSMIFPDIEQVWLLIFLFLQDHSNYSELVPFTGTSLFPAAPSLNSCCISRNFHSEVILPFFYKSSRLILHPSEDCSQLFLFEYQYKDFLAFVVFCLTISQDTINCDQSAPPLTPSTRNGREPSQAISLMAEIVDQDFNPLEAAKNLLKSKQSGSKYCGERAPSRQGRGQSQQTRDQGISSNHHRDSATSLAPSVSPTAHAESTLTPPSSLHRREGTDNVSAGQGVESTPRYLEAVILSFRLIKTFLSWKQVVLGLNGWNPYKERMMEKNLAKISKKKQQGYCPKGRNTSATKFRRNQHCPKTQDQPHHSAATRETGKKNLQSTKGKETQSCPPASSIGGGRRKMDASSRICQSLQWNQKRFWTNNTPPCQIPCQNMPGEMQLNCVLLWRYSILLKILCQTVVQFSHAQAPLKL
ncbi:hypothetical protein VP01_4935g1, partial [Puccinia sorghi]